MGRKKNAREGSRRELSFSAIHIKPQASVPTQVSHKLSATPHLVGQGVDVADGELQRLEKFLRKAIGDRPLPKVKTAEKLVG